MADFLPRQDDALVTWLVNFQSKVAAHAVALGLTAAQVTALQERCGRVITAIQAVTPAQSALAAAVTAKETAKTTELPALRGELNLIKANPAITSALLADLQIVGTSTVFNPDTFQPELTGEVVSDHVRIKFKKLGADGVNLYTRLRGQPAWTFLARDTNSPYDDHRPLTTAGVAETREYQAFGVLKDDQIGQPSAIVSVTFGG